MAEPARRSHAPEAPPVDPHAVDLAYRRERARRRARVERTRASKHANLRFWLVVLVFLSGLLVLTAFVWREIESLFGL
jgi:multisubunit Na+/H+ antiporter MnhB subunit